MNTPVGHDAAVMTYELVKIVVCQHLGGDSFRIPVSVCALFLGTNLQGR